MTIQINARVARRQKGVCNHQLGSVVGFECILNKNGARRKMVSVVWDADVDRNECVLGIRYVFEMKPLMSECEKTVAKANRRILKTERAFLTSLDPALSSDVVNTALHNEDIKSTLYHMYQKTILKRHIIHKF
jgi:hypothetical protein